MSALQTPRTESEFSAHSDDEYENEPVIQLGVPHMFGDKTSLYGKRDQISPCLMRSYDCVDFIELITNDGSI